MTRMEYYDSVLYPVLQTDSDNSVQLLKCLTTVRKSTTGKWRLRKRAKKNII